MAYATCFTRGLAAKYSLQLFVIINLSLRETFLPNLWSNRIAASTSTCTSQAQSSDVGQQIWGLALGVRVHRFHVPQVLLVEPSHQPQAASLTTSLDLPLNPQISNNNNNNHNFNPKPEKFDCLVAYEPKIDKELVVKWHVDDKLEPIFQWIPALGKRSILFNFKPHIQPTALNAKISDLDSELVSNSQNVTTINNEMHILDAGFYLQRPTKELAGKYKCSAVSAANDDSKANKMIVFTPPKNFNFTATRTQLSAPLIAHMERLAWVSRLPVSNLPPKQQQATTTAAAKTTKESHQYSASNGGDVTQLPLVYRSRPDFKSASTLISGFDNNNNDNHDEQLTSGSYVNVNPALRSLHPANPLTNQQTTSTQVPQQTTYDKQMLLNDFNVNIVPQQPTDTTKLLSQQQTLNKSGVRLVCDIDQVFPVPEINIYRLADASGARYEKLPKLETKVLLYETSGLYRAQVLSLISDDELRNVESIASSTYTDNASTRHAPAYFECHIALSGVELSKYANNRRALVYYPSSANQNGANFHLPAITSAHDPTNSAKNYLPLSLSSLTLITLLTIVHLLLAK